MPCYSPLKGYYKLENGQSVFTLISKEASFDAQLAEISCNQCIGCKIQRSKDWGLRCAHEITLHEQNSYITLTYAPEHLPENGHLKMTDLQNFWKKYRKHLQRKNLPKLRYYACGEYGDEYERPHYHAIIFGHEFEDREHKFTFKGNPAYTSKTLDKLWGKGQCIIMAANISTATYVAKYITKKQTGEKAREHYTHVDTSTGELTVRPSEFTAMSLKPGIGGKWLEKFYTTELYKGFLTHEGTKYRIPKYYMDQLKIHDPSLHETISYLKANHAQDLNLEDADYHRLLKREQHCQLVMQQQLRNLQE